MLLISLQKKSAVELNKLIYQIYHLFSMCASALPHLSLGMIPIGRKESVQVMLLEKREVLFSKTELRENHRLVHRLSLYWARSKEFLFAAFWWDVGVGKMLSCYVCNWEGGRVLSYLFTFLLTKSDTATPPPTPHTYPTHTPARAPVALAPTAE